MVTESNDSRLLLEMADHCAHLERLFGCIRQGKMDAIQEIRNDFLGCLIAKRFAVNNVIRVSLCNFSKIQSVK